MARHRPGETVHFTVAPEQLIRLFRPGASGIVLRQGILPGVPRVEDFRETRFVKIAHGGFTIWLDPFGMLDPQIVVNLFP